MIIQLLFVALVRMVSGVIRRYVVGPTIYRLECRISSLSYCKDWEGAAHMGGIVLHM
jgi:hypothetical protein